MMFNVDKSIGATHYTMLAAVEVTGKPPVLYSPAVDRIDRIHCMFYNRYGAVVCGYIYTADLQKKV
jgi:hypothetical protein